MYLYTVGMAMGVKPSASTVVSVKLVIVVVVARVVVAVCVNARVVKVSASRFVNHCMEMSLTRKTSKYLLVSVSVAVSTSVSATDVTVTVLVDRIVVVFATGTTITLTLRMTFLITVILFTTVVVEVGTLLIDLVPRSVAHTTEEVAARAWAPKARIVRSDLTATILETSCRWRLRRNMQYFECGLWVLIRNSPSNPGELIQSDNRPNHILTSKKQ